MHALVVYESMFGNTKLIAEAIAEGLSQRANVDLAEVSAAPEGLVEDIDLLVVGGPTHAFGLSRATTRADAATRSDRPLVSSTIGVREWIERIDPQGRTALVATFDTRIARPRLPGSAAKAAQRSLRRRGFRIATRGASFYVDGTTGPLRAGELERARAWAANLAASVAHRRAATG